MMPLPLCSYRLSEFTAHEWPGGIVVQADLVEPVVAFEDRDDRMRQTSGNIDIPDCLSLP